MFDEIFNRYDYNSIRDRIYSSTGDELTNTLNKEYLEIDEIFPLFSPAADEHLETMAQRSYKLTRARFGRAMQLYAPLYVSNECKSGCLYCGFNASNEIKRVTLTPEEVNNEAEVLYRMGFRQILLLTGEDRDAAPVGDLSSIISNIHKKFPSVSIEVYPMEVDEYKTLIKSGADGLTIYQETYNREEYINLHPAGRKRDFYWRLNCPDRGGLAGFRRIGIGALLGLSDWRVDGFYTALHARYLAGKYWKSQINISFPRIRNAPGGFKPGFTVADRNLAQLIFTMRIILNDSGLLLSTREPEHLRDNLFPLGITMMSAGSRTNPGGYSGMDAGGCQFPVEDRRSPDMIAGIIREKGFDPVWKDWDREFQG